MSYPKVVHLKVMMGLLIDSAAGDEATGRYGVHDTAADCGISGTDCAFDCVLPGAGVPDGG